MNQWSFTSPPPLEFVFAHIARCPEVFSLARENITPSDFGRPGEEVYSLILDTIFELEARSHGLTGHAAVRAVTLNAMGMDEDLQPDMQDADQILTSIYEEPQDGSLDPVTATEALKALCVQRRVAMPLQRDLGLAGADSTTVVNAVARAHDAAERIQGVSSSPPPSLGLLLPSYRERLEITRGRQLIGLRSGLNILDDRTCGLRGFMVLASAPNVGKSVTTLQIAIGVCRHIEENNAVVVYLSLDMSTDEVLDRLYCHLAGLDWKTFKLGAEEGGQRTGRLSAGQQESVAHAEQAIQDSQLDRRLVVVGRESAGTSMTASSILALADRAKTEVDADRVLVVVDYLQLLPLPHEMLKANELEQDKARVAIVQRIVDAGNRRWGTGACACLVVSEARKPSTSASRNAWGKSLQDLMGSARLGYGADSVILMRPADSDLISRRYEGLDADLARDELQRLGISPLTFELAKARDGMTKGQWCVDFHFRESRIEEEATRLPNLRTGPFPVPRGGPIVTPPDVDMDLGWDNAHG
jgi:replicative DNA helicase